MLRAVQTVVDEGSTPDPDRPQPDVVDANVERLQLRRIRAEQDFELVNPS